MEHKRPHPAGSDPTGQKEAQNALRARLASGHGQAAKLREGTIIKQLNLDV